MKIIKAGKFRIEWCWISTTLWIHLGNIVIGVEFRRDGRFGRWLRQKEAES